MADEKRLIDAIKHRLECHIAKAIHWGVDNIPMGKDSSSAFEYLRGYERGALETANVLLDVIPVDAVEVVRCKDCHWYDKPTCNHPTDGMNTTAEDDFCSYGERRDND